MATKKVKITDLADNLGMTVAEVVDVCHVLGIPATGPTAHLAEAYSDMVARRAERDGLTRNAPRPSYQAARQGAVAKRAADDRVAGIRAVADERAAAKEALAAKRAAARQTPEERAEAQRAADDRVAGIRAVADERAAAKEALAAKRVAKRNAANAKRSDVERVPEVPADKQASPALIADKRTAEDPSFTQEDSVEQTTDPKRQPTRPASKKVSYRRAGSGRKGNATTPRGEEIARQLIADGESTNVEFKQTARINLSTSVKDPAMEQAILKTIAGFLNASGGTLLVGVTDDGTVTGIEIDFKTLGNKQNQDGFELWLSQLITQKIGVIAATKTAIAFEELDQRTICSIQVQRGDQPSYVKTKSTEFYARVGNSTRLLNTEETVEYARHRWT